MYDPSIGRWLEEDPIGFDAGDANLYRYVGNDPTNAVDPSGLDRVEVVGQDVFWVIQRPGTLYGQNDVTRILVGAARGGAGDSDTVVIGGPNCAGSINVERASVTMGDLRRLVSYDNDISSQTSRVQVLYIETRLQGLIRATRAGDSTTNLTPRPGPTLSEASDVGAREGTNLVWDHLTVGMVPSIHNDANAIRQQGGTAIGVADYAGGLGADALHAIVIEAAFAGAASLSESLLAPRVASNAAHATSPLVPGGGLAAHEAAGGHTIARHVGQTDAQLGTRLAAETIPAASTFTNRAVAEAAIAQTLEANAGGIATWLSGTGNQLVITHTLPNTVGVTLARGATTTTPVSSVRVVIRRAPTMPGGFRIHTAYPE